MKTKIIKTINNFFQSKSDWKLRTNPMYNSKTKNYESNRG